MCENANKKLLTMEIREIKERLSIETVLNNYNLQPDRHHFLKCPFHGDEDPSLKIYPETNTFNCFGCGAAGDVIEFIERYEKKGKHEAILKAKSMIDPSAEIIQKPMSQKNEPEQDKELLPRLAVIGKLMQESRGSFKRTTAAKEYLRSRGLDPDKTQAGYMGLDLGKGWNEKLQQSAIALGILKQAKDTVTPVFKNVVLFFTKNEKGQVIDMYGRSINSNCTGKHFYLSGNHQGIYPGYPEPGTSKLILTECIIDCETLLQREDIKLEFSMMALFGTNGFTQEHVEAIKNLPELNEVALFFDGDESGREAVARIAEKIKALKPDILITAVDTPDEEDINSLIIGHEPEILSHLIKSRKPVNGSDKTKNDIPGQISQSETPQKEAILSTKNPQKIIYQEGDLLMIIWGGIERENVHRLRVNLLVQKEGDTMRYYQDDVNLYSNLQLQRYIKGATEELDISTMVMKSTLRRLQLQLEEYRLAEIERERKALQPRSYYMTREEEIKAGDFLLSKDLVKITMKAVEKTGLVGEERNGLLLFFLYLSRFFDEPLHAIIFGKSGSGKTYLQTRISECLPEESLRTITSLTENTLYYSEKDFWKHKVLLIEDLEGVYQAFLPLREFMSKQSITKLTTDKDIKGNNVQRVLVVEGPVCVSGATTNTQIYEDNANRSFLLHVDETPQHADQVMHYQRRQQAGLINEAEQNAWRELLRNAQRLLRPVKIINPYAIELDIPQCVFKKLRTNMHYLRLIEIITFYHQKQRTWKKNKNGIFFIESTLEDIEWANYLIKDSLLRKSDELSGQVRQFFEGLKELAGNNKNPESLYAKHIREHFRMHPMKANRYLRELEQRGYLQMIGGNRKTGYEYEISAWEEYDKLKSGIDILDEILKRLREKEEKKLSITSKTVSITEKTLSVT
ncbi:MAG TPA: CHC2 zinc finger domain-containing protein [Petrotogaceae bacterium]|nr:CHC2 zinc finger domain-containing protein [Petrotogaceae bacterium]HQP58653.1 CHC2 zinc finger domain-containing protein [Petrotogaceae bacterium]